MKIYLVVVIISLWVGDLVQMQEACADIKCSSPHQICRGSNPCYNKCSSQFCPAYLEYACFCESGYCSDDNGDCVLRRNK
ncbi:hypothetical protein YQE_02968, partial [Dendroctonus ponderosae]